MTRKKPATMTDLLRDALLAAPSLNAIEKATGVKRQTLAAFMRSEQTMRLDSADMLAGYFGIQCSRSTKLRKKGD